MPKLSTVFVSEIKMPLKSGSMYSIKNIQKSLDLNTEYDVLPSCRWCDHANSFVIYQSFDVMLKKPQPRSYFTSVELIFLIKCCFDEPQEACSALVELSLSIAFKLMFHFPLLMFAVISDKMRAVSEC